MLLFYPMALKLWRFIVGDSMRIFACMALLYDGSLFLLFGYEVIG